MNIVKIFALVSVAFVLCCCKASQPTGPNTTSSASILVGLQTLDTVQVKFYDLAQANLSSTPGQVMMLTADWLKSLPSVKSVGAFDSTDLDIELQSGMHTNFSFGVVGADSLSPTRGGEPANFELRLTPDVLATHTIPNKKVLIYTPFVLGQCDSHSLYHQDEVDALVARIKNAGSDFEVTVSYGESLQTLNTFSNYGLVFIDSHGLPNGFYSGAKVVTGDIKWDSAQNLIPLTEDDLVANVDQALGPGTAEAIRNGSLRLGTWDNEGSNPLKWQQFIKRSGNPYRVFVTGKYIGGLSQMPSTIIVGNFCYSGWQKQGPTNAIARYTVNIDYPIQPAWTSKQPISYYSYGSSDGTSSLVGDAFAKAMEDSLVQRLVINSDSTGDAYKDASGQIYIQPSFSKLQFDHFGADDYSYSSCGQPFTDARDGQTYKTVCIGKQVWMAQNLNFDAPGSLCYYNNSANCDTYGRLYDNATALQGVCPKGWHLPSDAEFTEMLTTLGGPLAADLKMRAMGISKVGYWNSATNSSGFSALPAGSFYRGKDSVSFYQLHNWALFRTTSMNPAFNQPLSFGLQDAVHGVIREGDYGGESCRCVKDP
jgi:uncharacterized protein (TIGR02145 family)